MRICKNGEHSPFINIMPSSNRGSNKIPDDDGLLGKKNKCYFECYICNAYYDSDTGKTAHWKKNGKVAKGNSRGVWFI